MHIESLCDKFIAWMQKASQQKRLTDFFKIDLLAYFFIKFMILLSWHQYSASLLHVRIVQYVHIIIVHKIIFDFCQKQLETMT